MHKKLILDAFKKAKEDIKKEEGIDASVTNCASYLSEIIEQQNAIYSARSFRLKYNTAKTGNEVTLKQNKIVKGLCSWLGYNSFSEYAEANNLLFTKKPVLSSLNKKRIAFAGLGIVLLVGFGYFFSQKDCWMQWHNGRYEISDFDVTKISKNNLKPCNEMLLKNFKQVSPDCNTRFFNQKNDPLLWYSKNRDGTLDFFTYHGLHPLTGKTLKHITPYIINKYICPKY